MDRTIKDARVKRFHYDGHYQLCTHFADFPAAYNFARRLKTLSGLTPYEYICKIWASEPDRFIVKPIRNMPGMNICHAGPRLNRGRARDSASRAQPPPDEHRQRQQHHRQRCQQKR